MAGSLIKIAETTVETQRKETVREEKNASPAFVYVVPP